MNLITSYSSVNFTHCPSHTHQNWEIICRISGSTLSDIGNRIYSVSDNDIMIIPPMIPHADTVVGDCYSDIAIHADFLDILDISDIVHLHDYSGNICILAQMLCRTMLEKETNYTDIADSLFAAILQYLKRLSSSFAPNPIVSTLKDIIYENVGNSAFQIADEIHKIGYHPDHVRRLFKKHIGSSPLGYLTKLRIQKARQLLTQYPFESISSIASHCGFSDPNYFSSCFKKNTGHSPQEYRRL